VPLLAPGAAAWYATQLARTCYQMGRQLSSNEAHLVRILLHCRGALTSGVTSAVVQSRMLQGLLGPCQSTLHRQQQQQQRTTVLHVRALLTGGQLP
jgi:hypothetical protein